jgi:hypothetical protein
MSAHASYLRDLGFETPLTERDLALLRALGAGPPAECDTLAESDAPARPTISFDGGARPTPPLPGPTHGQWLAGVLQHVRAGGGQHF